jgi:UDP-glucose 4-epimerase
MKKLFIYLALLFCFFQGSLLTSAPSQKCVLVVGGAGYIGSRVNEKLQEAGYNTIILDNLSTGNRLAVRKGLFIEGDLGNKTLLDQIFSTYSIDAVMHFAAFLEVGESVANPLKYYLNNVGATLNLLEAMHSHQVNTFIFSSTAAIFGMPETSSIAEDHPKNPLSPYGTSKWMIEMILEDLDKAYGMKFCALRYFNAAGGDPAGEQKLYKKNQSNLIPVILRNIQKPDASVTVFGTDYETPDGTGVRDYVHIDDLASAHIAAMERLWSGAPSACYNLGNGKGFSVKEVIEVAQKVTGLPIRVIEGERRTGDPSVSVADSHKAFKELAWKPVYSSLEDMIEHTWNSMHPER